MTSFAKDGEVSTSDPVRFSAAMNWAGVCLLIVFHSVCFYWWIAGDYYFNGDELFYFSRQVGSFAELAHRFMSVDDLYQYRPLTFVFFSFVLRPLFGTNAAPYHAVAYAMGLIDTFLACLLVYFWTGKRLPTAALAAVYLVLNPINFFASFGPTYLDLLLSSLFYFSALLVILKAPQKFRWLAVPLFVLALSAKEQSVMLPVHAFLMLVMSGVNWKEALKRTQMLRIALLLFLAVQLMIRHGALYAPEGTNPNLQFELSLNRIVLLAQGAKAALFYPENYKWDDLLFGHGRVLRLIWVLPWIFALGLAIRKRNWLALSGIAWAMAALPPIAFIHQAPFPRHYYLALPGIAVFFASVVQSHRMAAALIPMLALTSLLNVALYAEQSWVAVGSRMTKQYLSAVRTTAERTGRTEFYISAESDPSFYWAIDGGAAVPYLLGKDIRFHFASLQQPIPVDSLFTNRLNVVTATDGKLTDTFGDGPLAMGPTRPICSLVHELMGTSGRCTAIYKGLLVPKESRSVAETPSGLPVFRLKDEIVTISYGSFMVEARNGLRVQRSVRLVPESRDGVILEIYSKRNGSFIQEYSRYVAPGERFKLGVTIPSQIATHAVLRIRRGPSDDSTADWLVWRDD